MLRGVIAHCKRVVAAKEAAHSWRQRIPANQPVFYFFCNSTAPFSSSSSRKSSSLHNYYIRKRRKWPIKAYKTQWLENFAVQLAKKNFKQSVRTSKTCLLPDLINAFAAYEIDPTPQSYQLLFKILIHKRPSNCHDQISQVLDHVEKIEGFETPECIFVDLIKFYGDNNMFGDAVELFLRIPRFRCEPSVEVLNALLAALCKNEKGLQIVPKILVKSQAMNIRIEESCFEILIRALCKIGKARSALELLNQMVEEGFDVDQNICSVMLATMCRQLNCSSDEIMRFWDELKNLGFEPRKNDFFNMIRLLVKKDNVMDALKLSKQMGMKGVVPDIMCYNLILDGLIHNREFSNADNVFDELLVLGLVPDINTYNLYITGLCMQGKVEDGILMLGSMEDLGCAPDSNTYNTILRALCEAGKLDKVREMVNKMQQKCMQLNSHTYEMLINGFVSNDDVNGACSLFEEMLDRNIVPHSTILDKTICWMCNNSLHSKAVEFLEHAVIKNTAPGPSAWKALIEGFDPTFDYGMIVGFDPVSEELRRNGVSRQL